MIRLLVIDVDGVMCKGKFYDKDHNVIAKEFCDIDFTAIKRFRLAGVQVVFLSGDNWNKGMATKRGIPFYSSREKADKGKFLEVFKKEYNVEDDEICYVGDDLYDIPLLSRIKYSFCPKNSPKILTDTCFKIINIESGNGVISELFEVLIDYNLIYNLIKIDGNEIVHLIGLDNQQQSTKEMSK